MSDELPAILGGADDARAMPEALRARVEHLLVSRAWEEVNPLAGIDAPRALPGGVRSRVEGSVGEVLDGLDTPVEMPAALRARIERTLARPRRAGLVRAIGIAAGIVLFASSSVAIVRSGGSPPPIIGAAPAPSVDRPSTGSAGIAPGTAPDRPDVFHELLPPASVGVGAAAPPPPDAGPPPPFMTPHDPTIAEAPALPAFTAGDGGSEPAAAAAPPPPPLRIGYVGGNRRQVAGFRAYIGVLNEAGGVRGHQIVPVEVSLDAPDPYTVATVNLSDAPIVTGEGSPGFAKGPILESLSATEDLLRGRVRSFASPPERQAHLIADALYPDPVTTPITVVVYTGTAEPFATRVPDAFEAVLDARGVTVLRVPYYTDGRANLFVPGAVAFLSLSTDEASRWLEQTRTAGYQPSRGIAGIYSLFQSGLLTELEDRDALLVSPYAVLTTDETSSEAFRSHGRGAGVDFVHGWVTAKDLAVAIWRHDVSDAASMRAAVDALAGYRSGFAPAYRTRADSTARTPEGLLYGVEDGRFVARSGFLRDHF